ncbi:MAG: PHP domain-containing protein [Oscillospiraceae bacterium]
MTADLHCHTSASDAALTRDELVSYAALCGLKRIAITDHDTMKNSFCTAEDEVEVVTHALTAIGEIKKFMFCATIQRSHSYLRNILKECQMSETESGSL